jgi:hypothetical protein
VLGELGLPYSIVHDPDLTPHGLRSYSVLILSNIVGLSDRQKLAILTWTLGGGRLLATFGTSYRDVTLDRAEADRLRRRRADPLGLQQLWFDFGSKLFSSEAEGPFVDVQIARFTGPTANLGFLPGGRLAYGGHANLLPKLPPQTKQVLGWLLINESVTRYPAIVSTASGRGHTVYYAFAPEYLVSKEFEGTPLMPNLPVCADGQTWSGRSEHGRALMRDTVSYLLRLPRRR